MMPAHWKFLLDGFGERESGDVATRDGEVIGTWSLVDGVSYAFTPDGADEYLFFEPFLGMLCNRMAEWHENGGKLPSPAMSFRKLHYHSWSDGPTVVLYQAVLLDQFAASPMIVPGDCYARPRFGMASLGAPYPRAGNHQRR